MFKIKGLIFLVLAIVSWKVYGRECSSVAIQLEGQNKINVSMKWFSNIQQESSYEVIYGNEEYGFYKSENVFKKNNTFEFHILALGFKFPIRFYLKQKDKMIPCGVYRARNFVFPGQIKIEFFNKGESPFLGLNGILIRQNGPNKKKMFNYSYIVNRLGEIIWSTSSSNSLSNSYGLLKNIRGEYYLEAHFEKDTKLEIHNILDNYSQKIYAPKSLNQQVLHHDFLIRNNGDVYFLSSEFGRRRDLHSFFSAFFPPVSYVSSKILKSALGKLNFSEVFYFSKFINPIKNPDWIDAERLQNANGEFFKAVKAGGVEEWSPYGKIQVDSDHANSIREIDGSLGGFSREDLIVSLRNKSSIALIKIRKNEMIVIGCNPVEGVHTITLDVCFNHQHDALWDGEYLWVFDNGLISKDKVSPARLLAYRIDTSKIKIHFSKEFHPPAGLLTPRRGNIERLENGKLLAYFPKSQQRNDSSEADYLYELDIMSGKMRQLLKIYTVEFNSNGETSKIAGGYRAVPIRKLIGDFFLGYKI